MSYTKLFSSIVTSTIWTESADVCKVWVTMLAIADKHGEVHASIPGLAQIAGMPLAVVESAIERFQSPDKYSRTPDDEGRRIERIDGGWVLLNHAKYRAMASKDEEKSASAKRQAAFRERKRRNEKVTVDNGQVTHGNDSITVNRDIAEAEAEAEAEKEPPNPQGGSDDENSKVKKERKAKPELDPIKLPFDSPEFETSWNEWVVFRKEIKKPITQSAMVMQLRKFEEWGESESMEAIENSITNGYQGLFQPNRQGKNRGGDDQQSDFRM